MSETKSPRISVILPVYNAGIYLRESIDSILRQTYRNFELIIINDGSTDSSAEVIRSYTDERITSIDQKNQGLASALNTGIEKARGEYIARQDNDDISLPARLEKQLFFMDNHPEVALLGTAAEVIDEQGRSDGRYLDHLTGSQSLKFYLIFNNPFVHSSVFIRRSVLTKTGGYTLNKSVFEDHNLWSRIARVAEIDNLSERLIRYREVSSSMSRNTDDYFDRVTTQSVENIRYYCPDLSEGETRIFLSHIAGAQKVDDFRKTLGSVQSVMDRLAACFAEKEKIPVGSIRQECRRIVLGFKRNYYSGRINADGASFISRLKARMARKLMFVLNRKYLS